MEIPAAVLAFRDILNPDLTVGETPVPDPPVQGVEALDTHPRAGKSLERTAADHTLGIHEVRRAGANPEGRIPENFIKMLQPGGGVRRMAIPAVPQGRDRLPTAIPGDTANLRIPDAIAKHHDTVIPAIPLDDGLRGIFPHQSGEHVGGHGQALGDTIRSGGKIQHIRFGHERIQSLLESRRVIGLAVAHRAKVTFHIRPIGKRPHEILLMKPGGPNHKTRSHHYNANPLYRALY